jgi:hypothetical protein
MRFFPDLPGQRARTIAADVAVVLALVLFAWLGAKVHDAVQELTAVSSGVQSVGGSVEGAFRDAGSAVDGAPIVGDDVRDALQDAGEGTGGKAAAAGREGEESIESLASLLGWLTFLAPAVLLLSRTVPPRVRQVRQLTAAAQVLLLDEDDERRRLLAQRAAFGLSYATLVRYTRDPLGDLQAGRLEPLVAAAREDAGLSPRR